MFCSHCGAQNDDNNYKCVQCHVVIERPVSTASDSNSLHPVTVNVQNSKSKIVAVALLILTLALGAIVLLPTNFGNSVQVIGVEKTNTLIPKAEPRTEKPALLGPIYTDKSRGFEFNPPATWQARSVPGFKYEFLAGPVSASFAPNINIIDEESDLPLEDYFSAAIANAGGSYTGFKNLGNSTFETNSGLSGIRFLFTTIQGRPLRQIQYFFAKGKKQKLIVTCTAHAELGDTLDSVFDTSLRTFAIQNAPIESSVIQKAVQIAGEEKMPSKIPVTNSERVAEVTAKLIGTWIVSDTSDGGFHFGSDGKCFIYNLTKGPAPLWQWSVLSFKKEQLVLLVTSQTLPAQYYSCRFDGDELLLRKMADESDITDEWGRRMRRTKIFDKVGR